MRITSKQLKRIIKEELEAVKNESLQSYIDDARTQSSSQYSVEVTRGNTPTEMRIKIKHPNGEFVVGSTRDQKTVQSWEDATEEQLKNFLEKRNIDENN
jgi:hypothetical protein